jgi:hypothetical protein
LTTYQRVLEFVEWHTPLIEQNLWSIRILIMLNPRKTGMGYRSIFGIRLRLFCVDGGSSRTPGSPNPLSKVSRWINCTVRQ